jgi:hypothetical protein
MKALALSLAALAGRHPGPGRPGGVAAVRHHRRRRPHHPGRAVRRRRRGFGRGRRPAGRSQRGAGRRPGAGFARRAGLDWSNPNGVRRIVVRGGADGAAGPARGNVEVLTYARSLAAGEIVQPEDLVWVKVAAGPADAPNDADALIGMAAKRPLRAGRGRQPARRLHPAGDQGGRYCRRHLRGRRRGADLAGQGHVGGRRRRRPHGPEHRQGRSSRPWSPDPAPPPSARRRCA